MSKIDIAMKREMKMGVDKLLPRKYAPPSTNYVPSAEFYTFAPAMGQRM